MREFRDAIGVHWRAWSTVPRLSTGLESGAERGWLTFESPTERRRLAPIPTGWETVPDDRLALMCRAAVVIPRRDSMAPKLPPIGRPTRD